MFWYVKNQLFPFHSLVPVKLFKTLVTMNRVTYFIQLPSGETALTITVKQGEDLEKIKVNGPGRFKLGKGRNSWW